MISSSSSSSISSSGSSKISSCGWIMFACRITSSPLLNLSHGMAARMK
jgi:hypothetical protein